VTSKVPLYAGYIFDLDGTVYLGDELIPGAENTVAALRARGAGITFVSNKPIATGRSYAEKLTRLGIAADVEHVLTSPMALAHYISAHHEAPHVLVLGEEPVLSELRVIGCRIVQSAADAEIVVISWDRQVTYGRLDEAFQALRRGAFFYVTNPDVTCPLAGGSEVSDAGAVMAYMEACSGRTPDHIAGKPSPALAHVAMARMGTTPEETLLIGDRLETDLVCGKSAGCATATVLSGVTDEADLAALPADCRPDYVLGSIAQLL
jgi:arabinose operon protein AraL